MKTQRFIFFLLALTIALVLQSPGTAFADGQKGHYSAKLISPKVGAILMPGTVVRIEWTAVFPNVDPTSCETEILLSVDGGNTFSYVTSQRNPTIQYFDWIVPRSPTNEAVLDIRFGCLGLYPETPSPQLQAPFIISSMD